MNGWKCPLARATETRIRKKSEGSSIALRARRGPVPQPCLPCHGCRPGMRDLACPKLVGEGSQNGSAGASGSLALRRRHAGGSPGAAGRGTGLLSVRATQDRAAAGNVANRQAHACQRSANGSLCLGLYIDIRYIIWYYIVNRYIARRHKEGSWAKILENSCR